MSDLAYHARVQMTAAQWDDMNGSTVTFALPTVEDQRNPFHNYTKRRKGKAGTRFMGVVMEIVNDAQGPLVYKDEMMLAGWNDSQQNGHTVKFWLCADAMGHPFEGYQRKEDTFYISLVELDDDQEPIDPKMRDRVERQRTKPSERVSFAAVQLCKNEKFWDYLTEITGGEDWSEDDARQWLCNRLNIQSRGQLDQDKLLAEEFHDNIRRPFLMWQGEY